ncbi:MAG TPA: efflux RND transporter periplasmic adaptor subunit [Nitrospiria bacterium]|nr:efflux RND transporter periplasmic adaptor subunit [Nitrospiria bacterium]
MRGYYGRIAAGTVSLIGLVLLLLWMQGVIGRGKIRPGLLSEGEPSASSATVIVHRREVGDYREVVGTLSSKRTVTLSSKIPARILSIAVRAGDRVKRGEKLVVLDSEDLSARLAQAEANLRAARAQQTKANSDFERAQRLLKGDVISRQAYDQSEAAHLSSEAEVAAAEQRVKEARIALGEAALISPLDGVVIERSAEPGDLAVPGQPLLQLEDPARIRLEAAIPEGEAVDLSIGKVLQVRIDSLRLDLSGTVEEIVPVADPTSRSFLVRLSLPSHPGLKPGIFGRVRLPKGQESLLLIPKKAVRQIGQLETVRVLEGKDVRVRQVLTGRTYGDEVEILSGLSDGDRLIVGGGE